jgi:3-oxoacyl-(acyl-carrier-protein) synthase
MTNACSMAGISTTDIDHINMHGTSTKLGDAAETKSIKSVFGDHAYNIQCNSTKSMTGHTLGAAGAIESIAALLTTYHDVIPPTINFSEADPECDLNYTFNESVVKEVHYAMNNAFGFGGHNTALIFKKYQS